MNQYYYLFEWPTQNDLPYRCVGTLIGGMGPPKAALVGGRLIHEFGPETIVNIGIAGSMDNDVSVGDVVVAEQVDDYLSAGKDKYLRL